MKSNLELHRFPDGTLPRYSSVGGYPYVYLIEGDGVFAEFCPKCAREVEDDSKNPAKIFSVVVNWEDPELYCEECGERIESAYTEDKVP